MPSASAAAVARGRRGRPAENGDNSGATSRSLPVQGASHPSSRLVISLIDSTCARCDRLPFPPGTAFNRSPYEDVLVVRVHGLVPEDVWRPLDELINQFEANLAAAGTRVVKPSHLRRGGLDQRAGGTTGPHVHRRRPVEAADRKWYRNWAVGRIVAGDPRGHVASIPARGMTSRGS